jgi:hypothetical protein
VGLQDIPPAYFMGICCIQLLFTDLLQTAVINYELTLEVVILNTTFYLNMVPYDR